MKKLVLFLLVACGLIGASPSFAQSPEVPFGKLLFCETTIPAGASTVQQCYEQWAGSILAGIDRNGPQQTTYLPSTTKNQWTVPPQQDWGGAWQDPTTGVTYTYIGPDESIACAYTVAAINVQGNGSYTATNAFIDYTKVEFLAPPVPGYQPGYACGYSYTTPGHAPITDYVDVGFQSFGASSYVCPSGDALGVPAYGPCQLPVNVCDNDDGPPSGSPLMCHGVCKVTAIENGTPYWSATSGIIVPDVVFTQNPVNGCDESYTLGDWPLATPKFAPVCLGGSTLTTGAASEYICTCPVGEEWSGGQCRGNVRASEATPVPYSDPADSTGVPLADAVGWTPWTTTNYWQVKVTATETPGSAPGTWTYPKLSSVALVYASTKTAVPGVLWSSYETSSPNGNPLFVYTATIGRSQGLLTIGGNYLVTINGTAIVNLGTASTAPPYSTLTTDTATYTVSILSK